MKYRPEPAHSFAWADKEARRILGPQGCALFERRFAAAHRYAIAGQWVDPKNGLKTYGVVGSGSNWVDAVRDAEARYAEFRGNNET